ncbi:MAG: poly-beta-1,6 N-acetyl-D-glucosamine export porin PgaA [Burkholderiaceae bacterium]|nr:poly-beta-1,6 N-acetyl-D-glucosamine export porin PgaA [Burkholderiaceae bacterium]
MRISCFRLLVLGLFLPAFSIAVVNPTSAASLTDTQIKLARDDIAALERNGLPYAALKHAQQHPEAFSPAAMRGLEANYLAELTRLSTMPTRQSQDRYAVADRAIAEYDRLIPAWQALGQPAHADVLRLRYDRIQALHARVRMQDVVMEYENLEAQGVVVPRYILNDVASAYLYLHQPEKARDLYRRSLSDPQSTQDSPAERLANETGLFYALIETENFDEAQTVIDAATAKVPIWVYPIGGTEKMPNDLRLYAEQAGAMGLLYADQTAAAQNKLTEMVELAPNHSGLRAALATVHLAREHPRLAEQELQSAQTIDPLAREVIATQGQTALELQEWRQADILTNYLQTNFPEDLQTQQLVRDWTTHNKAEVVVSGHRGLKSDSPVAGSDDFGVDVVAYTMPISYNWRLFAGGGYASSDFEEGSGRYRWARGGAEWRGRDLSAEVEISNNDYGHGNKLGARAAFAYDLNDQWQIGAALARHDRNTPLRALRNDVSSDSAEVSVRWRGNEQREWALSVKPSHFSDGNHRLEAVLNGRERLYTSPHFKADLLLGVAASHNSADDAFYFNPRSDLEVLPAINLTHTLYRRYDTVLEHNLLLGAGIYKQHSFGSGAIAAIAYGMRYRTNKTIDVGATISGVSRPYDGIREREVRVVFDMNFRF